MKQIKDAGIVINVRIATIANGVICVHCANRASRVNRANRANRANFATF